MTHNHIDFDVILLGLGIPAYLFALVFIVMLIFVQRRYIIKRYEEETDMEEIGRVFGSRKFLLQIFPISIHKSIVYTAHLCKAMTSKDNNFNNNHRRNGLLDRREVLSHFSRKELIYTAVTQTSAFLGCLVTFIFLILNWCW